MVGGDKVKLGSTGGCPVKISGPEVACFSRPSPEIAAVPNPDRTHEEGESGSTPGDPNCKAFFFPRDLELFRGLVGALKSTCFRVDGLKMAAAPAVLLSLFLDDLEKEMVLSMEIGMATPLPVSAVSSIALTTRAMVGLVFIGLMGSWFEWGDEPICERTGYCFL